MADLHEGIVQQYAEHLLLKASSVVRTWTVVGALGGLALGGVAGFFSHSVIAHSAGYLAVILGGLAGGFAGRGFGENRAVGLRFQAQMALRQLQIESRLLSSLRHAAAPVAATPAPEPVPVVAAPAPVVSAPAPIVMAAPAAPPPLVAPAPAPEPAPLVLAPEPPAPPAPAVPLTAPPAPPRLVEPPPPVTPPLSSAG